MDLKFLSVGCATMLVLGGLAAGPIAASETVSFDVNSIVAAQPLPSSAAANPIGQGRVQVQMPLTLSALITGKRSAKIEQIHVYFDLKNPLLQITSQDLVPSTTSVGDLAVHDQPKVQLTRGTTLGGRGAILKLTAPPGQTLEGSLALQFTASVPQDWRGGVFQVRAVAYGPSSTRSTLARPTLALDSHQSLGQQTFLVVAHRAGDSLLQQRALELMAAEQNLQQSVEIHARTIARSTAPTVIHQFVSRLELNEPRTASDWLERTLFSKVDPHHDPDIKRLPVDVRVAVLDYQEAQREFEKATQTR